MSSASPPLRVTGTLLRVAAVTLICLCGVGTFLGAVGDVLMGPGRQKHTHTLSDTCPQKVILYTKHVFMLHCMTNVDNNNN